MIDSNSQPSVVFNQPFCSEILSSSTFILDTIILMKLICGFSVNMATRLQTYCPSNDELDCNWDQDVWVENWGGRTPGNRAEHWASLKIKDMWLVSCEHYCGLILTVDSSLFKKDNAILVNFPTNRAAKLDENMRESQSCPISLALKFLYTVSVR